MPLRLTALEDLLSRLNLLPTPLFDAPLAPGIARVLVTACELHVFDVLDRQGMLPLEALAEELSCHPQGLQLLLQLLVSSGYLRYRRGKYRNSRMTRRWLCASSSLNVAPYILHSPDIVAIWDHLLEVVRTNKQVLPVPYEEDATVPETQALLARHYAGLAALALVLGRELVSRVSLPRGASQLLDVGGSHAGYSTLFCRKYPNLQATILDIQAGIDAGHCTACQWQLEERMHFVCANIVQDDFTTAFVDPFDVALYFHIAHLMQPEINQAILAKVAKVLRPGGMLVFVDQVTDQTQDSHLATMMVQCMTLTVTAIGGTCYPFETVKGWLEQVGMGQVRRHRLFMPGATLVTAVKNV